MPATEPAAERPAEPAAVPLTGTSKADFSDIYTQPDPRRYYRTLAPLEYQIPRRALPVFRAVLSASRRDGGNRTILDVCCSYGVNSALLLSPLPPDQVTARYTGPELAALSPGELAAADRRHYTGSDPTGQGSRGQGSRGRGSTGLGSRGQQGGGLTILGLDASAPAIAYATSAGLLASGWAEDLESGDPSPELAAGIADVGLIISTGGIGYVGRPTFERLLKHLRRPEDLWLTVFVLRVFDYGAIADLLAEYGLVTENLGVTFRQRRFADDAERTAAIADVRRRGLDPEGKEADGWYQAECYLTRPAAEAARVPAAALLARSLSGDRPE